MPDPATHRPGTVLGLGTDLVDVERFARAVDRHGEGFLESLFSPAEISACRRVRRCLECLAALFAAREAALKALGTGLVGKMAWKDIEVLPGVTPGAHRLALRGSVGDAAGRLGVKRVHVALATTRRLAAATVVLEG